MAGIFGLRMCATTEIPEAQYFPLLPAPRILDLNFFLNLPETVDLFTPTFSKIFPFNKVKDIPPPSLFFFLNHTRLENFFYFFQLFKFFTNLFL